METFAFLKYMVEQEHEAIDKLLDQLDDPKLDYPLSKREGETDTIGSRLAHTIGAEYRMATYLYQENDDIAEFKVDKTSIKDIREKSQQSMQRHLLTLNNLSHDDLNEVWTSKVSGKSYEYKFLLWHFIEHLATHRGQVAMAINGMVEN